MATIQNGLYEPNWREHRRRRRVMWLLLLGFIPGVVLTGTAIGAAFATEPPYIAVAVVWMLAILVTSHRASALRCPRCGQRFYAKGLYHNGFTRKCLHCGLRKWADEDPAQPA